MKKSSSGVKNKEKAKGFSLFVRITSLFIVAAAIIVSAVFSIFYLDSSSNLSIEFAGGYQTQVKYDGVNEDPKSTQNVINLLENRVDPLGTTNINIEKSTSTGNYYNLSISKSTGIDLPIFINNIARRGYVYLLDSQGHDLLANKADKDNNWSKRDKRIITTEAFSSIYSDTNRNSGQPEVVFSIQNQELNDMIRSLVTEKNEKIYFYSDLGGLLNYVRNTLSGLQELVRFIDAETDTAKQASLKVLLANNTPGLDDPKGERLYNAVKYQNSTSGKQLINLLNQTKNGIYMIDWVYSDALDSNRPLSVDTNDAENVFDPANPFDPDNTDIKGIKTPVNAWLPHIKDLIILPEISKALDEAIINYKYAPYYIGIVNTINPNSSNITINDDTFNKEKVEQIVNLLNAGKEKNNFTVISFLTVDPTLGARALQVAVIGMLVTLIALSIGMIFNYRLLGVVAVFIIILFLVATLVSFTFLNNIVAPETGIALIIGLALLLDTIVGLFNSIQREYKTGKTIFDSFNSANKKSLVSAFDCSLIVLIVSLTIFWFGSRSIRGFAIMASISTFGVIILGVLLLRLVLYLLLKNNTFENNPDLLSLKQDKINSPSPINTLNTSKNSKEKKTNKTKVKLALMKNNFIQIFKFNKNNKILHPSQWNFWYKSTKWVMVAASVILVLSGIVYLAVGANFGQGFDSRIDFTGQAAPTGSPSDEDFDIWQQANDLRDLTIAQLDSNNKSYQKVYASLIIDSLGQGKDVIKVIVETTISTNNANDFRQFLTQNVSSLSWNYTTNNALSGNQLFKNMLIAIAISLITIFIYIIVRFQLTFAIPLLSVLAFSVLVSLALISLTQITITTMTIGVILALVILVLINSVVIFDNIKEIKLNNSEKRNDLEKKEIIAISNESIKKSLSRTLIVNSIIILTALIVVCFLPSFWSVSVAIIVGTIVTFVATHFIGPWLWTFFERWRIKRYQKRIEKIKKNFVGPDEYIIEGIND